MCTGQAVGKSISELDTISEVSEEHYDVRIRLKKLGEELVAARAKWTPHQKKLFFFPPKFDLNQELPISTARKILSS